jgi:hypothetical protein
LFASFSGFSDAARKNNKLKTTKMALPTQPTITRLSDDSVMVRWEVVPEQDSIPITFFKIQYRETGKDKKWETADGEISSHLKSFIVPGLRSGLSYRFRIMAVYDNMDNRAGPKSAKFTLLKNPPMKKPKFAPNITSTLAVSQSAIEIQWTLRHQDNIPLEGFYIHFRPSSSAGEYFTETVHGANTNSHIISPLLPDIQYDIKIQVFNSAGPSNFSNIVTNKTLPSPQIISTTTTEKPVILRPPGSTSFNPSNMTIYIIVGCIAGIAVIIIVLLIFLLCIKMRDKKKRVAQRERRQTKLPKEKHPKGKDPNSGKSNSTQHLNHTNHFSQTDYGNPYGNYSRSSGLNGNLARSVNGLSVKGSIANGFVFDSTENDRNEISIQVNPVNDNLRIDFEGRSRTLTSTTFIGARSHSTKDLLRRSNHNLERHVNERSVDGDFDVDVISNTHANIMNGHASIGRRKVRDEVYPNANPFSANGTVRSNHRSTSFTRLNGTLERKKRFPIQREEMVSSTDHSSSSPSASPSSTSSSNLDQQRKVSNNHHNHAIHNMHTSHHIHNNNNEGLLTRVRTCRETNPSSNGPLVIMQSSC